MSLQEDIQNAAPLGSGAPPLSPDPDGGTAEEAPATPYFPKGSPAQAQIDDPRKGLDAVISDLNSLTSAGQSVAPAGTAGDLIHIIMNQQLVLDKLQGFVVAAQPVLDAAKNAIPEPAARAAPETPPDGAKEEPADAPVEESADDEMARLRAANETMRLKLSAHGLT